MFNFNWQFIFRKYKRAKVIERRRRRRSWFQEQLESGKMDKSQLYLIYTKKKLPCDLPKKVRPTNTYQQQQQQTEDLAPENVVIRKIGRKRKLSEPEMTISQQFPETEVSIHRISESEMVPEKLHFSHNENSIVVTSFGESGIESISELQGGVPEYSDHMDFIVKGVEDSDEHAYWKMERQYEQQEY